MYSFCIIIEVHNNSNHHRLNRIVSGENYYWLSAFGIKHVIALNFSFMKPNTTMITYLQFKTADAMI